VVEHRIPRHDPNILLSYTPHTEPQLNPKRGQQLLQKNRDLLRILLAAEYPCDLTVPLSRLPLTQIVSDRVRHHDSACSAMRYALLAAELMG
jgi:hypothetical protein